MIAALMLVGALALQDESAAAWAKRNQLGHGLLENCAATGRKLRDDEPDLLTKMIGTRGCSEYISGAVDALHATGRLCTPDEVTLGQEIAVVLKYLEGHPELLHRPRFDLVQSALLAHWACRPKKK